MTALTQLIGEYEVRHELGRGSMGSVYKCWDEALQRFVALKLLSSTYSDDTNVRRRFEQEARILASLRHPHIPTVFRLGKHQSRPFIVMEFVDGQPLTTLIDDPHPEFSLLVMLRLIVQVSEALAYTHSVGVVHRDIKPANIMVQTHEIGGRMTATARLVDFSIARTGNPDMTQVGQLLGTPSYMSPEQARGEQADHRSDVFALGAVLYEVVSGHKAFPGKSIMTTLERIQNDDPLPLDVIEPACPRCHAFDLSIHIELARIVAKALQRNPHRRYQHVAQMRHDVARLIERLDDSCARRSFVPPRRLLGEVAAWLRRHWRVARESSLASGEARHANRAERSLPRCPRQTGLSPLTVTRFPERVCGQ